LTHLPSTEYSAQARSSAKPPEGEMRASGTVTGSNALMG
jgi:hypothetical protein